MDRVREWYETVYGERGAESIPEDMTWNGFFLALSCGNPQQPVLDPQVQERCIRRLAETCRTDVDTIYKAIGGNRT
jgi:hypothetical protein